MYTCVDCGRQWPLDPTQDDHTPQHCIECVLMAPDFNPDAIVARYLANHG